MTNRSDIYRQACISLAFLVLPAAANAIANGQDYQPATPPSWIAAEIPLRDGRASEPEAWFTSGPQPDGALMVRNVSQATLIPVLPTRASAGMAVIILPGGALYMLSMEGEGLKIAHALADAGIAAFILKYRLEATPDDPREFWRRFSVRVGHPGRGADTYEPEAKAAEDLELALRLVRARATAWSIDPHRICVLGFSSGANVALAATLAAVPDARPDYLGLLYGSMEQRKVPADAPPLFAALASNDPIFGQEPFDLVRAWRTAKRPAELHLYERGGHGFGLAKQNFTSDRWLDEFIWWLDVQK